jgi:hypothetical protein
LLIKKLTARIFASQTSKVKSKNARGLTKKAEPPPTRDVNRDSGTDRAIGGWLQRVVRRHGKNHTANFRQSNLAANATATPMMAKYKTKSGYKKISPVISRSGVNISLRKTIDRTTG